MLDVRVSTIMLSQIVLLMIDQSHHRIEATLSRNPLKALHLIISMHNTTSVTHPDTFKTFYMHVFVSYVAMSLGSQKLVAL